MKNSLEIHPHRIPYNTPERNAKKFQKSPQFIILRFFMTDLQMPRLLNDSAHKKREKRA